MNKSSLIVFVKNPQLGKVKTRLAAQTDKEIALKVYQTLLKYTRQVALGVNTHKEVWYSNKIEAEDIWKKNVFTKRVQKGANIGERMLRAFEYSFNEGKSEKVVLIGSDCAELTPEIVNDAFSKLDDVDVVIGPAVDGGYYLLGMRVLIPEVFREIDWSTQKVLKQTLERMESERASHVLLKTLRDVDELEDWVAVKHKFPDYD